jgi:lysophospholipase L1-like esterase
MSEDRQPRLIIFTIFLVALGVFTGIFIAEITYRVYLYAVDAPSRFVRPTRGLVQVYGKPFWIYDEEFGYVYPKGEIIHNSMLENGKVVACWSWEDFNKYGNIGPVEGNYDSADLKILVFGDSFNVTLQDGQTWVSLLQRKLTERLGRKVHVVNFGRDGYGVLQMFDLAAAKMVEWKPDLAIFTFITNDLQRIRFWRTITKVDGLWRYLVSPDPTPNPDPRTTYDTGIYHPEATPEWCRSMKETGGRDRIIDEVLTTYQRGVAVGEQKVPDILTMRHSFLSARLRYGDPFKNSPKFFFPVLRIKNYADDRRFLRSLKTIEETGIPYVLFHLAFYPEIKLGREFTTNYTEAALADSLRQLTGHEIHETTRYVHMPVENPERMNLSEDNYHPSRWGMELYVDAVVEMLIRNGHVKRGARVAPVH